MDLLAGIFSIINKMFKWCELHDGYNKINVQLFHPERCVRSSTYARYSAPINYGHPEAHRSDPPRRRL